VDRHALSVGGQATELKPVDEPAGRPQLGGEGVHQRPSLLVELSTGHTAEWTLQRIEIRKLRRRQERNRAGGGRFAAGNVVAQYHLGMRLADTVFRRRKAKVRHPVAHLARTLPQRADIDGAVRVTDLFQPIDQSGVAGQVLESQFIEREVLRDRVILS
jgi:hypothetical protein